MLLAINPLYAAHLIADQGLGIFWAFGSIVLAVTGAEALYADMGHFGRRPIRTAWLSLVMPGLLLNYFGQGALIIEDPTRVRQVFFELVPQDYIIFLVALATFASVIASQAVITGVFSLTRQAIQLGYLPRMAIQHTSETTIGQIYIPTVNWILMARRRRPGGGFRLVGRVGRRLWPRRHRRHAGRCGARHGGGDPGVEVALAVSPPWCSACWRYPTSPSSSPTR